MTTITKLTRQGFTLVELMVVILIFGGIVTMVTMNWERLVPDAQLNSSVRTLSDILNGTRSEAIARNAEFRVLYDIDADTYWVETPFLVTGGLATVRIPGEEDFDEGRRATADFQELAEGVDIVKITIDGEEYMDGQVYVRFSPSGGSNAHLVQLHHAATNTTYTVEVLALTGLIRFHKGLFEREEVTESDFQ